MIRSFGASNMSWIFLDTSDRGRLRVGLLHSSEGPSIDIREGSRLSLLKEIGDILSLEEIRRSEGICVVSGPGSFSAIRGGVLVANLLSRLYHIPLYGVEKSEAMDLSLLRDRLSAGDIVSSAYVSPVYDAEPNITQKSVSH